MLAKVLLDSNREKRQEAKRRVRDAWLRVSETSSSSWIAQEYAPGARHSNAK